MDKARFNKNVTPEVDWQGRVTGYWAKRLFPVHAAASRGQDYLDEINAAGFTPFGHAGEAMDPPEPRYRMNTVYRVIYREDGRMHVDVIPESEWRHPQDPPEPWPSDKTATWVGPPNCLDSGYALARCSYPNCNCPFDHPGIKGWCARGLATDEYPSGYRTNGEAMAQAQHEAAIDGDGCTAGACLLTRGAND